MKLSNAAPGPRGPMFSHQRRRRLGPLLGVVGVLAAGPAVISLVSDTTVPAGAAEHDSGVVGAGAVVDGSGEVVAASADVPAVPTARFASVGGLALHLPSLDTLLVGFHEASQKEAQAMLPHGRLLENANTTRIDPPADAEDGPEYVIMSSRGRTPAATSAVDLVMRDDDPVLAPVTGTVTDVRGYFLYGKYQDHRIEIQPEDAPDLRVVLIHVADVRVATGDRVTVGETPLAGSANRFDFGSHIDRYLEPARWPHVHVEVKRAS